MLLHAPKGAWERVHVGFMQQELQPGALRLVTSRLISHLSISTTTMGRYLQGAWRREGREAAFKKLLP